MVGHHLERNLSLKTKLLLEPRTGTDQQSESVDFNLPQSQREVSSRRHMWEGRRPDVKNQKSAGKKRLSPGSGVYRETRSTLSVRPLQLRITWSLIALILGSASRTTYLAIVCSYRVWDLWSFCILDTHRAMMNVDYVLKAKNRFICSYLSVVVVTHTPNIFWRHLRIPAISGDSNWEVPRILVSLLCLQTRKQSVVCWGNWNEKKRE